MRIYLSLSAVALAAVCVAQTSDPNALITFLRLKQEADRSEALAMAAALGLPVRQELPNGVVIELVKFRNGKPMYLATDNVNAAITTRASRVHPGGGAGLSLTGSGVILGEWDGGSALSTHQEFGGRVTVMDGASSNWHSTHVAGTMIASGVNAAAKGMAWGATLRSYNWTSDETEMGTEAAGGLRASNHSYGYVSGWSQNGVWYWYGDRVAGHTEEAGFGYYDDTAHDWDAIAVANPYYLIFKSAGNDRNEGPTSQPVSHNEWNGTAWISVTDVRPIDGSGTGYDTIGYNSLAKNVMTVGAVGDVLTYTGPGSVAMSSFSCWGPTDDGRIKPDIVANGVSLTSSSNGSSSDYTIASGTSMATPNACGSAALILQHFKSFTSGTAPRADLLKGLIIHTADECGPNPGPDYMFGWGLMNVEAACALISDNANVSSPRKNARMRYGQIQNGQTREWPIKRSSTSPIRVTLCWTDEPGTVPPWSVDPPDKVLVADLDLRIIAPDGTTTYLPWHLDKANPANAATKADNDVDNVEQVVIDAPTTGTYKIRVSHKAALAGTVNFALVTDNAEPVISTLSSITTVQTTIFSGTNTTGIINFTAGAFFPAYVTMSDNAPNVTVPATVQVPEGMANASFTVTTTASSSDATVTLTGVCAGVTRTATLRVWATYALQSTWMNKSRVIGGSTPLGGFVRMNHPAPMEGTVTLSSNSPSMTPPGFVLVPEGAQSKYFDIPTTLPASDHLATLSAIHNGITKTATVTIITPPVLNAVNVSPSTVTGGNSTTGTVYFSKAGPSAGVLITISDNRPEIITPATALIPALQWFGTFSIGTTSVVSPVTGTVTATYRGVVRTKTMTVNP